MNLAPAQRNVRRLMRDTCLIERDADAVTSGVIDEETLELVVHDDLVLVYRGICFIQPALYRSQDGREAGLESARQDYVLSIPHDAKSLEIADRVTVLTSQNAGLVQQVFTIRSVSEGSIVVWRQADMRRLVTSLG